MQNSDLVLHTNVNKSQPKFQEVQDKIVVLHNGEHQIRFYLIGI